MNTSIMQHHSTEQLFCLLESNIMVKTPTKTVIMSGNFASKNELP